MSLHAKVIFFFSSRRRHTRSDRDWSSDVCSSDLVRTPAQSQQLAMERDPCIVVASGGMCDGGRIIRHLKQNLDDPRCSLVLVSYQAAHSLGRQLLDMKPTVRFHGRNWN